MSEEYYKNLFEFGFRYIFLLILNLYCEHPIKYKKKKLGRHTGNEADENLGRTAPCHPLHVCPVWVAVVEFANTG